MGKRGALMSGIRFREILRLTWSGFNAAEVARASGCARSTVQDYVERATGIGLTAERVAELSDSELLTVLGKKPHREYRPGGPEIDWTWVSRELARPGVTLALLWEEKFRGVEGACGYSAFCRRYRKWGVKHEVTLRQIHHPGEKSFVDFSGLKLCYCNTETGEVHEAEIFVGALGASNLTYVEATASQKLTHWLGAHVRMFGFFGGVTEATVPDNLKSGVANACRYEPEINRAYLEFAEHYGTAVLPARANKPKDKAKVEKAVQDIQHWILAPLRDREFHSVAEINAAIVPLLEVFNARNMKDYGVSRRELFERTERVVLKPLPQLPFQFALWKRARVNIDYHIEVERHYYSVPYYLVRKDVEIRITEKLVEVFFDGKRVAFHARSRIPHQHTTLFEHMPPEHQAVRSWSKDRFLAWSKGVGPETESFVATIFAKKTHAEQAFRAILGLQRLAKKYGSLRLENACKRGNHFELNTMRSIRSILESSKDKVALESERDAALSEPLLHDNLRGSTNFH
jgi:transposase